VTAPHYRNSTNFLRGAASLSVLIWHYQHFFFSNREAFTPNIQPFFKYLQFFYLNGYFAVQLFWCISGLVLCHAYMSRPQVSFRGFTLARFSRLYPLHLITLIVVALLQILSRSILGANQIYFENDLKHFLLNLIFIQNWGFQDGESFNAPSWSVSVEIAVYMLFFIFLKTLRRTKSLGSIAMLGFWILVTNAFPSIFFGECLSYFLVGVSIWFATSKRTFKQSLFNGLLSSSISYLLLSHGNPNNAAAIIITLVFLVSMLDRFPRFFNQRLFKRFGELTYSVFLWHVPLQLVVIISVFNFNIDQSIYKSPLFLFAFLMATYAISNISFIYIERPAKEYLGSKFMVKAK
jgi:peptidoglycan/LPS O-acetylase OafA/YrhL